MISEDDAHKMLNGKPVAKGKVKRAEKKHDSDLEGKMAQKVAENAKPHDRSNDPTKVSGASIRGVMQETIGRCYEEFWPGMNVTGHDGNVDVEIQEEAYILMLTMLVGNDKFTPRRGLKIKEIDGLGDSLPMHRECPA